MIQYKEPLNYGKEHNECTTYQETKYILQIHLDANIFFHTITLLANRECFKCGSALQLHSQVLINPVTEHRKQSRYMRSCLY